MVPEIGGVLVDSQQFESFGVPRSGYPDRRDIEVHLPLLVMQRQRRRYPVHDLMVPPRGRMGVRWGHSG